MKIQGPEALESLCKPLINPFHLTFYTTPVHFRSNFRYKFYPKKFLLRGKMHLEISGRVLRDEIDLFGTKVPNKNETVKSLNCNKSQFSGSPESLLELSALPSEPIFYNLILQSTAFIGSHLFKASKILNFIIFEVFVVFIAFMIWTFVIRCSVPNNTSSP